MKNPLYPSLYQINTRVWLNGIGRGVDLGFIGRGSVGHRAGRQLGLELLDVHRDSMIEQRGGRLGVHGRGQRDHYSIGPRRIERYLGTLWESGALPVIVLSKADLCPGAVEMTFASSIWNTSSLAMPGRPRREGVDF